MSPQLEFKLSGPIPPQRRRGKKRLARAARGGLGTVFAWAPVWISFLFLLQLTLFGLRPAWAEKKRLDAAELEVREREEKLLNEYETLERDHQKLADEIYRERVRKSLFDPELPPLTLEGARSGEK